MPLRQAAEAQKLLEERQACVPPLKMEGHLAQIIGSTRAELTEELGVPETMIADICARITIGERAYRALIVRFKLNVELEQLFQAQKEFSAVKQLERIERLRGGSERHR